MIRNRPRVREDFPAPVLPTIPTYREESYMNALIEEKKRLMFSRIPIENAHYCLQWTDEKTNKQTNLLSCINSDVNVTDGQVQILVVT